MVALPLSVACGHAVGMLDERMEGRRVEGRRVLRVCWVAPAALLLVTALLAALMWKPGWSPALREAVQRVMASDARRTVQLSAAAGLVAGIAPLALAGTRLARPLSLVLLVAIAYPPVRSLGTMLKDPPSLSLRRPPSVGLQVIKAELSHGGRMLGLPLAIGYPNTPLLYDIADLRYLAALPDRRLRTYFGLIGPQPPLLTTNAPSKLRSPLLDLADVRLQVRPRGGPRWPVHPTATTRRA
jgi:hypothetical protein